ncbi:MAG: response regulator [Ardenticatenaceae bacterium]|nr:response regulator [Ardenticatenaceae bacterium]
MNNPRIHILLIEDNSVDAQLIRDLLADAVKNQRNPTQFLLTHARRLEEGLEQIRQHIFDIILLDLSLPDSFGLGTFERVANTIPNTPIVLLTGLDDELLALDAMQQGAQDYLVKGDVTNSALLSRAIRYAIERHRLVSELSHKASELEARNAALDAFSHTMAHQIRGPLSQIIGYAEYAETTFSDEIGEDVAHILNRILQSGLKMNNMISEILLLASVRSQSDVALFPLDMKRIVGEVRKRLRLQIYEHEADLQLPGSWPTAIGHAPWLEEVWVNYITNALKYGGTPPQLTLGATQEGDMIRFWVEDNGPGIGPEDKARLFKPHSRLHEPRVKGEGLGLSIVLRIVQRLGGNVGVDSEVGKGSRFWFTLPVAPVEEREPLPPQVVR